MQVNVESRPDGITVISLHGRMDIEGAQAADLKLAAHVATTRGRFLLDLADVSFLASIGIRSLLTTAKAVRSRGGLFVMAGPTVDVERTLKTAGIDALIPMYGELPAAVAALNAS